MKNKKINRFVIICMINIMIMLNVHVDKCVVKADDSYVPICVDEYLCQIDCNAIEAWIGQSMDISNIEYEVKDPFMILGVENVWYYPVYINGSLECSIVIYYYDGNISHYVTDEYINQINNISDNNWIIYTENSKIYLLDSDNKKYEISDGKFIEVMSNDSYQNKLLQLENFYEDNMNIQITTTNNRHKVRQQGGSTTSINGGKECIMNGCFVQQYEYELCWAASVATIVRYFDNDNTYSNLNAFDVAIERAEQEGLDTSVSENVNQGADPQTSNYMLALYQIYYTYVQRKLNRTEIKNEIDNGYPIYMSSRKTDNSAGHATVLYGYYDNEQWRYYKIWNPGNHSTQITTENVIGEVTYHYNGESFIWRKTLAKANYIFK